MSRTCAECDQPTGPDRRVCKSCTIEERHGTPADHLEDNDEGIYCWVQDLEESWHASMYFEGDRHVTACGEILECPVADVRDDPRRIVEVLTCDACEAALEADEETIPDGGEFSKASQLRADGSGIDVEAWVLENITEHLLEDDEPWSARRVLRNEGRKLDGVEKTDVDGAVSRLANADEIVTWHGLVAHADDKTLNRIIELELGADITRKLLIGKCNQIRKRRKAQSDTDAESTEREVATDGGHRCDWCGVGHPTIAQALRCCSEVFDERVNSRPMTDGGCDTVAEGTVQEIRSKQSVNCSYKRNLLQETGMVANNSHPLDLSWFAHDSEMYLHSNCESGGVQSTFLVSAFAQGQKHFFTKTKWTHHTPIEITIGYFPTSQVVEQRSVSTGTKQTGGRDE